MYRMYYVVWITQVVSTMCSEPCYYDQLNELSCSWFVITFDVQNWLLDLVLHYKWVSCVGNYTHFGSTTATTLTKYSTDNEDTSYMWQLHWTYVRSSTRGGGWGYNDITKRTYICTYVTALGEGGGGTMTSQNLHMYVCSSTRGGGWGDNDITQCTYVCTYIFTLTWCTTTCLIQHFITPNTVNS